MTALTDFSAWYKTTLGHRSLGLQVALWFLYGVFWIPLWFLFSEVGRRRPTDGTDGRAFAFAVAPASAGRRLVGYILDSVVGIALTVVVLSVLSPRERRDVGPIFMLITPFYSTFFLEALFGRSLGKLVTGTRVITANGTKPGWGRAFGRMLARLIPFEPLSFRHGVTWHDYLSDTRVVESAVFEASLSANAALGGRLADAVDSTHRAAAQLERAGMTGHAEALRSATADVQSEILGVDPGGYSGEYRLLRKRTRDGGIVFWIRDARAADDMDVLFRMLLSEAANVPEQFRQRFLGGQSTPVRRAIACPKGGYELHVDLRS